MTLQTFGTLLGVAGFILSLLNAAANLRWRTVGNQATLLSQLRPLLNGVLEECVALSSKLDFDRYDVSKSLAQVPNPPDILDKAIDQLPDLSGQLISPSKARIDVLRDTMVQTREQWSTLVEKLNHTGVHVDDAMGTQVALEAYSRTLVRLLTEYVNAVTAINKGKLWARWKYRDHWTLTSRIFRFRTP